MTGWTTEQLDAIGAADELSINTRTSDGSLRAGVTIWVVRVGDEVYIRSYRGEDGLWYRHAASHPRAIIEAGGVECEVALERPDDSVASAVDEAYRTKYARYGAEYVDPMVTPQATATTLRLTPLS